MRKGFISRHEDEGTLKGTSLNGEIEEEMDARMGACHKSSHCLSNLDVPCSRSYSMKMTQTHMTSTILHDHSLFLLDKSHLPN